MIKVFYLLAMVFTLSACGAANVEDDTSDTKAHNGIKQTEINNEINNEVSDEEINVEEVRNPLPFDTDEFVNSYNNALNSFEDYEVSTKLSVGDDHLTLTFGDLIEAQLLLNILNKFSEGEAINELAKEMVTGLTTDGYYINEENINGFDIIINAPDISSVMVVITTE